jgi:hypothetical protein
MRFSICKILEGASALTRRSHDLQYVCTAQKGQEIFVRCTIIPFSTFGRRTSFKLYVPLPQFLNQPVTSNP